MRHCGFLPVEAAQDSSSFKTRNVGGQFGRFHGHVICHRVRISSTRGPGPSDHSVKLEFVQLPPTHRNTLVVTHGTVAYLSSLMTPGNRFSHWYTQYLKECKGNPDK